MCIIASIRGSQLYPYSARSHTDTRLQLRKFGIAAQRLHAAHVLDKVDGEIELAQRLTALQVLHQSNVVEGKVEVFQALELAQVFFICGGMRHA